MREVFRKPIYLGKIKAMESLKQMMDDQIDHLTKETDQLRARLETLYDEVQ